MGRLCGVTTKRGHPCPINCDPGHDACHVHRPRPDLIERRRLEAEQASLQRSLAESEMPSDERPKFKADASRRITVYTDGSCWPNPGPGGWAWVIPGVTGAAGYEPFATNQRMEIMAVAEAIAALKGHSIEIVSDSRYVVDCVNLGWYRRWRANGWRNSSKKAVANRDLWEPLVDVIDYTDVRLRWVRGHNGDPGNDAADELAGRARVHKANIAPRWPVEM